ncbi:MAG: hypothetical protein FJ134_02445 [Deltaproteobacteria bacterium]|nr:hypothetical protein [Deltaproteobacteria bacterium]
MKFTASLFLTLILCISYAASPTFCLTPPRTEKSQTALFHTYDRNRDGKITLQECLDLNDCRTQSCRDYLDGVITLDEFLASVRGKDKK